MKVKYSYLDQQFMDPEPYFEDLRELVKTSEFTLGPFVAKFEQQFSNFLGVQHVIGTNSGTSALILALKAAGVGLGDEVITVANTFYATAGAIVAVGATPRFVDCDERYSIDVSQIERAINSKTKAILPVHWVGAPCDIERVLEIATQYKLKVIEDACQASGACVNGRKVGTFGHLSAFSMHPLKPLNVWGDAGMIATNDDSAAKFLRLYQNHGLVDRDHIDCWGINCRLQPVQAVIGSRVLPTIEKSIELRIRNAALLDSALARLEPFVIIPQRFEKYKEVFLLYMIRCQQRDALLAHLIENGIEAKVHYPLPLHLQKPARELGYKPGDFPMAERQATELISLPAHQFITSQQIQFMVDVICDFYAKR